MSVQTPLSSAGGPGGYLTTSQAASYLGLARRTVADMCASGELDTTDPDTQTFPDARGRWHVHRDAIRAWKARQRRAAA